ncbi:MAG: hypothetical protein WED59_03055 [Candidatus Woykebacteria bacterium]
MQLSEFLSQQAEAMLLQQKPDGSFTAGHNGPYFDEETPVRNTAHWLFTFCELYKRNGQQMFADGANKAAGYLLSSEARPMNASFWCRKIPKKDFCNGVMGQAWVLEALIKASEVLNRDDCYELAEEVFKLHPWDAKLKVWRKVNVDGSFGSYDSTFNHQLWFGAVAGQLYKTDTAKKRSLAFFEAIGKNVELYPNGVVFHASPFLHHSVFTLNVFEAVKALRQKRKINRDKKKMWHKSAGYHAFNLYAYCLYRKHLPNHPFWESNKFNKMISVINNEKFINEQINNIYSYPYNPTGFEIAYTLETFYKGKTDEITWWINQQNMQAENPQISNEYIDKVTLQARIYELCRLDNNYKIKNSV